MHTYNKAGASISGLCGLCLKPSLSVIAVVRINTCRPVVDAGTIDFDLAVVMDELILMLTKSLACAPLMPASTTLRQPCYGHSADEFACDVRDETYMARRRRVIHGRPNAHIDRCISTLFQLSQELSRVILDFCVARDA